MGDRRPVLDDKHCLSSHWRPGCEGYRRRGTHNGRGRVGDRHVGHQLPKLLGGRAVDLVHKYDVRHQQVRLARVRREGSPDRNGSSTTISRSGRINEKSLSPPSQTIASGSLCSLENRGIVDTCVHDQAGLDYPFVLLALLDCRIGAVDVGHGFEPLYSNCLQVVAGHRMTYQRDS